MTVPTPALTRLARRLEVLTTYRDARGNDQSPSAETLMAVVHTLGVDIGSPDQTDELLDWRPGTGARLAAPVIVVWDGAPSTIEIDTAEHRGQVEATLVLETGETIDRFSSPGVGASGLQLLSTPEGLPLGYHELHVRAGRLESKSTVLCAPRVAWTDPRRRWIGFLPLYALHSKRNPGVGDLTDLAELVAWLKELEDGLVGTLPATGGVLRETLD